MSKNVYPKPIGLPGIFVSFPDFSSRELKVVPYKPRKRTAGALRGETSARIR